jgi:prepilin-type N-terminal cleavage/methylation domain-containing protein
MGKFIKTLLKFIITLKAGGFKLIELLVVLIIVGILAGLAIPNFTRTRERAFDKEAQTALRLIQAAERVYSSKYGMYRAGADTTAVNANLQLDLASTSWNLSVSLPSSTTFSGVAVRTDAGNTRNWTITQDTTIEPTCLGGTCP